MADYFTLAIGLFSRATSSIRLRFMIELEERISYADFTRDIAIAEYQIYLLLEHL